MSLLEIIILALIQALTEFLPISSSAHLALAGMFLGWDYQGLVMDLALHLGTLVAGVVYFRHTLWRLFRACISIRWGVALDADQRLGVGILMATVPGALAGLLLGDENATLLRHPLLIACNLAGFGLLLWWADRRQRTQPAAVQSLTVMQIFVVGLMQALALVPGVSRSGITMTAALWMGIERSEAARLSFLVSVPITALAAAHGLKEALQQGSDASLSAFALGAFLSAVFAWLVIHYFLRFIRRIGVTPFVVYRLLFALVVAVVWMRSSESASWFSFSHSAPAATANT